MKVCVVYYRGYEVQRFYGNDVGELEQKAKRFITNEIEKSELIHPEKLYYHRILL